MEFDFRNPDYDRVFKERAERLLKLRQASPDQLAAIKLFYRDHPAQFISDWGMTYDPLNAEIGQPTAIPFILFPKQVEFVEWVYDRWRAREDGLGEKTRDMGVSWLSVAVGCHMWQFFPGTVIGYGSRKEVYVDDLGDPKSLFWKSRFFINNLPAELRPAGWDPKKHAPYMRITNPETGSVMVGEAGDNIGRGARTSIYFKDESAFYERPDTIEAALSQTSNCKIDISTPNGSGNAFYRKRHSGKIDVFTFHWRDDPRKDEAWYEKQKRELDPVILAQEVDIDYNASVDNAWFDGSKFEEAHRRGPADIEVIGSNIWGIDAAHFGNDNSVLTNRKGRLTRPQIVIKGMIDGPDLAGRVVEEIEATGQEPDAIIIELDGPGVSCFDTLRRHPKFGKKVVGVHTGQRLNDGKNYNLRAKMARRAKEWLDDAPCVLPRDGELKAEAMAMAYSYRDGLLLMEDKKTYKKRLGRSPDRYDSWALTFAVDAMPHQARPAPRNNHHGAGSWMG